ncbi:MAG: Fic family protein [Rickettsiales bacterium]|nr:Fic family protein [Rickettsiales bacterium]
MSKKIVKNLPKSPPFIITSKIVNLIAKISEQVGRLNASLLNSSPQLRKKNRIKTIAGTLAIEGNGLSEDQITAIIEGQRVLGSARELAEVAGAISAYDILPELQPHKINDLLKAHNLMMSGILVDAGKFRNKAVGIHKGGKVHHIAPPVHQVSGLMADLLSWLKKSQDHPLIISSVFHYEFEFIHPFTDGNGRLGRLWQTLILSKWNPLFLALPLESVIKDRQKQYYQALGRADKEGNSGAFIEFMLSAISETLTENNQKNVPINAPINAPINFAELKTTEAVLMLVKNNPQITRQEIANILQKDVRTIGRAIASLQGIGKLKRIGPNKSGYWQIKL